MKEIILKILLENTKLDYRYTGGDEIPILVFKDSENVTWEELLSSIADDIIKEIKEGIYIGKPYYKYVNNKFYNQTICFVSEIIDDQTVRVNDNRDFTGFSKITNLKELVELK